MERIGVLDVDWPALFFQLDLKEPGDKAARIKRPCLRVTILDFLYFTAGFRASRPLIQAMYELQ